LGGSGGSANPNPPSGEVFVWHIAYHVITIDDAVNEYFELEEDIAPELKDDVILIVETDVQSRDDFEAIPPRRVSWGGKGLENDPAMQAGWRVWIIYPVKTTGISGGGGATAHNNLTGRSAPDAHPMSAITGLASALAKLEGIVYTHNQTTPAMVWNIQHNLGVKYVSVIILDADGDEVTGNVDWNASTDNLLVVNFGMALGGTAHVKY
jgi:hypothetical protein